MQTQTGHLVEDMEQLTPEMAKLYKSISKTEHEMLLQLPEKLRPRELALKRYRETAKTEEDEVEQALKDGFRAGYEAGKADLREHLSD